MIVVDTDHFSVLTDARHEMHSHLKGRLLATVEPVVVPVIAVEEQLRGWLAQVHRVRNPHRLISPYDRLVRLLETLSEWEILRWNEAAANEFDQLQRARIRIGTQDLRVASLAIAHDARLLSANLRDFEKVPGLRVENWLNVAM
jgi:tRNA(fMet)-specific endonuclease VapC